MTPRIRTAAAAEPPPDSSSGPDPFDDADALDELACEITTLAAHIAAADHRLLVLLADFDRRRGWELGGHRSCAQWLHVRTAMDPRTAREKVRVARALETLPQISEAMSRGELSFSQVRALTRAATPECEEELVELARGATVAELEKVLRRWRTLSRSDEAALERERYRLRRLAVYPDDDGTYVVRGRVTAEVGAVLMRAIEAAGDALFSAVASEETTPRQRRADALGLLAERALAAGFGREARDGIDPDAGENDSCEPAGGSGSEETRAEIAENGSREPAGRSNTPVGGSASVPVSGTRTERYQVMIHVKAEDTHLEDGTRLTPDTSRRLCCDAAVVRIDRDSDGSVLDVGRRTRTIPPALRRALEVRDGGCRFPGCGLRFTDGHHLTHWAEGGETNLDNLVLLCRYHHRKVHEGGWRVEFWGEERHAAFIDPVGGIHIGTERPTPELPDQPVEALVQENEERGIEAAGWELAADYERATDLPWPLRARVLEALDSAHFGV